MILLLTTISLKHKGRTDSEGGHYDRSTGEYHYHHGYPAHQHIDGICPYSYDDQTSSSYTTSTPNTTTNTNSSWERIKEEYNTSKSTSTTSTTTTTTTNQVEKLSFFDYLEEYWYLALILACLLVVLIAGIYSCYMDTKRNKE